MNGAAARISGADDGGRGSWLVPAAALATLVLLELLRLWLPSLIFIFGVTGETPATTLGAFAVVWFLVPLLLTVTTGRVGTGRLAVGAVAVVSVARLVVQAADGGALHLYAASVGFSAAIVLLAAVLAGAVDRHRAAVGVALGMAAQIALHAGLQTVGLGWRDGPTAVVAVALVLAATVFAVERARRDGDVGPAGDGPAWPWIGLGPLLVLAGVLSGATPRVVTAVATDPWLAAALVVAAHAGGVLAAVAAGRIAGRAGAAAVGLVLVVGTTLALPADGPAAVVGQLLLGVGVGAALGLLGTATGTSTPRRRAMTVGWGMLLFFVLAFAYYAAYDIALGYDHQLVLVAAAVVAAIFLLAARDRREAAAGPLLRPVMAAAVVVAVAALGAGGAPDMAPRPAGEAALPLRVMLYNVHMGYGTAGRFDTAALADVIRAEDPDVVVLNEVDRGWLLNGGHDVLGLLADDLGYAGVFGPAADEVWGNAVLSRYPLRDLGTVELPRGGAPMVRSATAVALELSDGSELGIIGTHLHHVEEDAEIRRPQAGTVAALAGEMAREGMPVAVLGDLNAEPGAPELEPLYEVLEDGVTPLGEVATFPSDDPVEHIDHILVTPGLVSENLSVPRTGASDHLPVAVTLRRG